MTILTESIRVYASNGLSVDDISEITKVPKYRVRRALQPQGKKGPKPRNECAECGASKCYWKRRPTNVINPRDDA